VDLFALTRDLLALDSTTGREGALGRLLQERLRGLGYDVTMQEVTPGRWNVYAHHGRPRVVFSTHLDTVPPYVPPREDDRRIYGRGSCDAKGIVAAMIAAAQSLPDARRRNVGLLFLVGEETMSDGARAAAALEPKGQALIGGEPTEGRLATAGRGTLRCLVRTAGRAAHSALEGEAGSAIERLLDLLVELRRLDLPRDPELGATSYNIGTIAGGVAANVVPPHAQALILFRTVDPGPSLRRTLERWAAGRAAIEFPAEMRPIRFAVEPGFETTTIPFGTDLPLLAEWGRRYLIGPGSIRVAHTDGEYVEKPDLEKAVATYARLTAKLLERPEPAAESA
jgi:acetylornithine deacetylase